MVLLRKDRYDKKLEKYLVVVEEGDTDISDLEEVERHETQQALCSLGSVCPPQADEGDVQFV